MKIAAAEVPADYGAVLCDDSERRAEGWREASAGAGAWKENHITRGTVQMAYQELVHQGYAYAVRGSGTYISEIETARKKRF